MKTAIGMMSGTSVDGIDVALIRSDGQWHVETGPAQTYAYPDAQRAVIRQSLGTASPSAAAVNAVTKAHQDALRAFMQAEGLTADTVDLIGFHGQTVFHDPDNRVTVQIGDGQALADAVAVPVVSDFRSADVKAGGQGAPFAPLYHAARASQTDRPVAVLNLGGVGNVTWIGAVPDGAPVEDTPMMAFDTGPANALMDDWVFEKSGAGFDAEGRLAASGKADQNRVHQWLDHPYFSIAPPKSLDRDAFDVSVEDMSLNDGLATLLAFTVRTVGLSVQWLPAAPSLWAVTGGGRHNRTLMQSLSQELGAKVVPVEDLGWEGDALEAQAFAWLAIRAVEDLPTSVPSTTGVPVPTVGGVINRPV